MEFVDEYNATNRTNYLLGSVLDRQTVSIAFEVYADTTVEATFGDNTLTRSTGSWLSDGFAVGDKIVRIIGSDVSDEHYGFNGYCADRG
jgi:hypothetical protein